ncbi:syntaxin-binding protein 5 isoform X2 [Coccinella septempunctata]|uniref:syntaxin-binding protein 5 isoform X2 n=1 Tax=Coccinella septempunctata TaxID=41139 RepID=UPI001D07CDBE|nr:syntaxin-binding protein 5 isoform X2 [Coccinella septempunctata]
MRRDRDSDRREVMKKFTFKGVLDNFRTSVAQQSRPDQEIQETLRPEHFQVKRTFRHGFPFQPTSMAFDPVQKLLAIGSKCGSLRILGQPGVDIHVRHDMEGPPGSSAVLHLQFLVNEGALLSATADDTLHLWNFRQKMPQVVQSLKFQKEKITCVHLPLQSKWIYVGTEKGNVHVVQIENFHLSGYVINWNKAIEATRKTRPGCIVHLSDNPLDASKLLIGFESGLVVLWDLRNKAPEMRWVTYELRSITWHHEGKQFMCSHTDGTLTTWSLRSNVKYTHISQPLAKVKDGKAEPCRPINKVEWKTSKTGEAFVIFSGGTPKDQAGKTPCITVVHNKTTTVLEMEHTVVDFITLCESPYPSDLQDPFAIIALLQNDLVVMDLHTPGFPPLENPYPMDIHESAVTCCTYLADCPADLIPAFYSVGRAGSVKKQGFSEMDWPVGGGTWSAQSCSYSEIIMTGHADGNIKFWDASAGTLQVLYKLKTAKVFEKPKARSLDSEDEPFAVELISLCPESRKLCVAGASSHVVLFTFKKTETNEEITTLEIPIVYEVPDEGEISPDCQFSGPGSAGSGNKMDLLDMDNKKDSCSLKVRPGVQRKPPGFQAQMVCLTPCNNGESPSHITALSINSWYGLMAYGNEAGIVIVDIEQKVCLLNIGSPDLYGAQDPYSRVPRSPKKNNHSGGDTLPVNIDREERQPRSPSIDQMGRSPEYPYSSCPCPTPVEQACEAVEEEDKTVPIPQAATRRKSSTWKTFNFKRQLSKVDMKVKKSSLKEKRNSVFHCDIYANQEEIAEQASPESDENTLVDSQGTVINVPISPKNNDQDKDDSFEFLSDYQLSPTEENTFPFVVGSLDAQNDNGQKKVVFTQRPDNLELEEEGSPVRPPRGQKKRPQCRDQRLLSVPNIKFQKSDLTIRDLRDKEDVLTSPQPTFTGNLMRRFNDLLASVAHLTDHHCHCLTSCRSSVSTGFRGQMNGMCSPASGYPTVSGAGSSGARARPDPPRRSRSQGTRKLHKCLSTASYSEDCVSHNPSAASGTQQRQQLMVARQYCSFDKLDNSFSRSRSSSMSSLENITSEAIQVLAFNDSYTKRSEPLALVPSLWVGTSLGSVLAISIIPPDSDSRSSQPVVVSLMGTTIFRLKGGIIGLSFLDCNGCLIPYPYESWRDDNREKRERTPTRSQGSVRMSPTLSETKGDPIGDRQYVVITSEKQARVVALPSQTCIYRQQITDSDFVVKAETVTFKDSVCLVCYLSNGHLATYSLPSLRPLMDIDFLPLSELSFQTQTNKGIVDPMLSIWGQQLIVNEDTDQIARTFCFSNRGHGLYLATPSELQKFTICSEFCSTFNDMVGELFLAMDMPEPPKEGFFKGLFGGGVRQLDREELFGESSGKANKSVAKHIPGNLQDMGTRVTSATSEVNRAHKLMLERGERLNRLEDSAERMRNEAENFSSSAHEVMLKYRDKKWYQL